MDKHNNHNEEYEPTPEEWAEIEETIIKEEEEELQEARDEDQQELNILKRWLKEHGMSWDRGDARSAEEKRK